jgi:hypothetical protein
MQQGQQQQQQQHEKVAGGPAAPAWFNDSTDVGASWGSAVNSSQHMQQRRQQQQQQQHGEEGMCAPDAYETQMEDMLRDSFSQQQQQQQQGSMLAAGGQAGLGSSGSSNASRRASSAPAPLSGVVIHDSIIQGHAVDTGGLGAASIPVAQRRAQQQQQQMAGYSPGFAHSLGFDHFHDVAQMQARLQQQRLHGSSSSQGEAAAAAAAAAMEAASWSRRRSSAGASSTYSDPDSASTEGFSTGGGQRGHTLGRESDSSHTFKGGSHKGEEGGQRSLAAVVNLFQIAEQELQADAASDAGATASAGAATQQQ